MGIQAMLEHGVPRRKRGEALGDMTGIGFRVNRGVGNVMELGRIVLAIFFGLIVFAIFGALSGCTPGAKAGVGQFAYDVQSGAYQVGGIVPKFPKPTPTPAVASVRAGKTYYHGQDAHATPVPPGVESNMGKMPTPLINWYNGDEPIRVNADGNTGSVCPGGVCTPIPTPVRAKASWRDGFLPGL